MSKVLNETSMAYNTLDILMEVLLEMKSQEDEKRNNKVSEQQQLRSDEGAERADIEDSSRSSSS